MTKDEIQKQYLVRVVGLHRKKITDFKKATLKQMFKYTWIDLNTVRMKLYVEHSQMQLDKLAMITRKGREIQYNFY